MLSATIDLDIYGSTRTLVPDIPAVALCILGALPSSYPWYCHFSLPTTMLLAGLGTLFYGSNVFTTAACCCCEVVFSMCPVQSLSKGEGDAWHCSLQLVAFYLSVGDNSTPGLGQKGLATPNISGIDYPLVAPLFEKFVYISNNPVFLPDTYITDGPVCWWGWGGGGGGGDLTGTTSACGYALALFFDLDTLYFLNGCPHLHD